MPPVPDRASTDLAQRVGSTDVLRAIVDNSLDAIMVSGDERRYVWANDAAAELTGLPVGELVGRRIDDLAHPTERPTLDGVWATFLESGRLRGRFELLRPDGRTVTTEFQAIANIAPGLHVSIMRDVSEQQASEEALQRSERRLRALVGNASEMVLIVGADRRVSFASQATRRVLGYAPADVVGEDVFASFIHPATSPWWSPTGQRCSRTGHDRLQGSCGCARRMVATATSRSSSPTCVRIRRSEGSSSTRGTSPTARPRCSGSDAASVASAASRTTRRT
jgi:PAS domain S-box-containing protein